MPSRKCSSRGAHARRAGHRALRGADARFVPLCGTSRNVYKLIGFRRARRSVTTRTIPLTELRRVTLTRDDASGFVAPFIPPL